MREVKAARKQLEQLLDRIEAQIAFYDDNLRFEAGGDTTEKKVVRFQRDTLYQEIWEISLSKAAKKYDIPYEKPRFLCRHNLIGGISKLESLSKRRRFPNLLKQRY